MTSLDTLWVWSDPALAERLGWYRDVAANRRPAKFRIAATIPLALPPEQMTEDALWAELDRLTPAFLTRCDQLRECDGILGPRPAGPTLLDLCSALAARMLTHCNVCAWNCRVDRSRATKLGACKLASDTRVSAYFHHPGEELVYRGRRGSGTIFFTSCNMRCAFCQNGDISTDKDNGRVVDPRLLATMADRLRREGCHNINWVGGEVTIHLHTIVAAIALLGAGLTPTSPELVEAAEANSDHVPWQRAALRETAYQGTFNAPMLWNSNFFMSDEAMRILRLLTDVWLPDFKFGPGRCATTVARTPRYWEVVTRNLAMIRDWGEDFTIRHLVMPGHVECCTYPVLDWIAANMPDVPVNVMDQYHPDNFCDSGSPKYDARYSELARRPSGDELRRSFARARALGLEFETISFEKNAALRSL